MGGRVDRLQARPAQPVDGQPADLDREAGQQDGHPGDVAVVLAGLVRAAEDHVLDQAGVDAGAVDDGPKHQRGEVVGPDAGERPAVAADRGTDRLDDPGLAEGSVRVRHARIVGGDRPGGPRRARARALRQFRERFGHERLVGRSDREGHIAGAVRDGSAGGGHSLERAHRVRGAESEREVDVGFGRDAVGEGALRLGVDRPEDPRGDLRRG